ncbi:MAG: hypothetical protein ABGY24_11915, partial [bacterium]
MSEAEENYQEASEDFIEVRLASLRETCVTPVARPLTHARTHARTHSRTAAAAARASRSLVRQEVSESEHEEGQGEAGGDSHGTQAPKPRSGLPSLPPRRAGRASTVVTTTAGNSGGNAGGNAGGAEPAPLNPKMAKVREQVQEFRTNIYRAAMRLRYPVASQMINQVMFRLQMAEKIHLEEHGSAVSAGDAEGDALEEAERLEEQGADLEF